MLAITTETHQALTRQLAFYPGQLSFPQPHVITTVVQTTPDYFGGGSQTVDVMLTVEAYNRFAARRPKR
jgi:hypothetical protein